MDRIRFGGLSSGIDTHEMVHQLMQVERMRVDRFVKRDTRVEWRQEAMNDLNRKLAHSVLDMRRHFGLEQVSYDGRFRSSSVSRFDWVKAARSSDSDVTKATASAEAMNGVHQVNVTELAKVGRISSLNLNDVSWEIGEGEEAQTVNLLEEPGGSQFSSQARGKTISFKLAGDEETVHTFTIGDGAEQNGTSVNDLVRFINAASSEEAGTGLHAAFDRDLGQIMMATRQTGADQGFTFVTDASDTDNITSLVFDLDELEDNAVAGSDAQLTFNGQAVTKSTNDFSIFGINLSLQALGEATVNVSTDVDSVVDKVKGFVQQYNELLDDLDQQLNENYYDDYPPLTDEQKSVMSDRDIEQWEERSRSGLLNRDEGITRMIQRLRSGLYEKVEGLTGSYNQMTQIGITTGSYQEGGRLVVDEDRLRNAIANDVDGVMGLMFQTSGDEDPGTKRSESGLIQRMNDDIVTAMKDLVRRGGAGEDGSLYRSVQGNMLVDFVTRQSGISTLQRERMDLNRRIAREEQILLQKEESYWQRFTAMEKAMGQMASQADWLMAQMNQF